MAVIEARFDELAFPACCCGCGSRAFSWREHTEKVVVWTVISVTKYRMITLRMPACDMCARRHWLWFGGAAAVVGLTFLYIQNATARGHDVGVGVALFLFAAIAMVLKGQASRPLRILGYDVDDRMIKLRIQSGDAARQMLRQPAHYESEHRLVRKPLKILLGVALVPFALMFLHALLRHHAS
jgi:hypothetical protein